MNMKKVRNAPEEENSSVNSNKTHACNPSGHQAGAYPSFRSMRRIGVFLLLPGWNASPSQAGLPPALIRCYPFLHLGGKRHYESKVPCSGTFK